MRKGFIEELCCNLHARFPEESLHVLPCLDKVLNPIRFSESQDDIVAYARDSLDVLITQFSPVNGQEENDVTGVVNGDRARKDFSHYKTTVRGLGTTSLETNCRAIIMEYGDIYPDFAVLAKIAMTIPVSTMAAERGMSEPQEKVDVGSLKDNFLECPVCVEHFNQTDRCPRLLHSCLHAFCTQCLQQLLVKERKGQITCPLCRQVQRVHGNADTLQVDGLRDKLVEFLQIKQDKKAQCSECPERNEAVSRCQECHSYLCKECDFVHRRHRLSRDHVIVSLGDLIDQPITSFAKGHFCPKHPKHNLEFYCATEEKLCCVSCTVLDHKGHDLQQLEEASAARKAELETKLTQVHGHADRLRNNKKQIKRQEKHIEDMRAKSLSDINTMFDHFKTVLDKRKLQLETDVKQRSARLLSILQKKMESNDQTLAVIDSTDTYFAQAKEKADVVEMLQMYPAINRSLESLTDTPTSLQLGIEQTMLDIRFVPQEASNIEALMANVGILSRPMEGIVAEGLVPQHLDDQTAGLMTVVKRKGHEYHLCPQTSAQGHVDMKVTQLDAAIHLFGQDEVSNFCEVKNDPANLGQRKVFFCTVHGSLLTIKVYKTNITTLPVDVIVNGANENLSHGGGVARAIAKAAGSMMENESQKVVASKQIPVTELAVTTAGNLPSKKIFHAVGPRWSNYNMKDLCSRDLCFTILRCLCAARNWGFTSIAFPSISAAIFGVPQDVCARMYVQALKTFDTVASGGSLREVHFVDVSDTMVTAIAKELANSWKTPLEGNDFDRDRAFIYRCLGTYFGISLSHHSNQSSDKHQQVSETMSAAHNDINNGYFKFSDGVSINIFQSDVFETKASALVSWEDTTLWGIQPFIKAMIKAGGSGYEAERKRNWSQMSVQGKIAETSGGKLPLDHIFHAVVGVSITPSAFEKLLRQIIGMCVKKECHCVLIPVCNQIITGGSSKNKLQLFIETMVDSLSDLARHKSQPTLHVHIAEQQQHVVDELKQILQQYLTSCGYGKGSADNQKTEASGGEQCFICVSAIVNPKTLKCGHTFCTECIDAAFKHKKMCPTCKTVCGVITGDMPPGHMKVIESRSSLPGYDKCGTIEITYSFSGGRQKLEHPDPGKWYNGITHIAYLPNNAEGQKVLALLKVAWERRLTFTIGRSVTMGKDSCITWNEIHHKTHITGGPTTFGYPDPGYLKRVQEELAAKGVTEADIDWSTPV
ncbi:uncharacterized protein LOC124278256 [Haliotis rubra]|uniref:uncharacterized protein LOC124278256 n=1 Tax=Haliotis rubra TaxID=36100 RepID=UPI001EE5EF98|nr:uncharacterized protein LOC124278256 [Haliotis rubra]